MAKNPVFERSKETQWLVDLLQTHLGGEKRDGLITYEELSEAAGVDVQGVGRGKLNRARQIILLQWSVIYGTVRGRGLQIRHVNDQLGLRLRGAEGHMRKAVKESSCGDLQKMNRQEGIQFLAKQSQIGFIRSISRAKTTKQLEIELSTERKNMALNYGQMLQALKPKKSAGGEQESA
jgi:hypothetical protein